MQVYDSKGIPKVNLSISGVGISAGTQSVSTGTVIFSNSNGLSFGMAGSQTVTGSYTVPTVTNSSWTVSDNATSQTIARLAFTNLNNVTLSLSSGAGGSATIVGSIPAQSNQTGGIYITAQSTGQSSSSTYDLRTLSIVGDGIVSAGWSNSTLRISATTVAQTNQTAGIYASSQTTAQSSSSTHDARSLTVVGDGIVSVGWSNSSFRISATTAAQTNQTGGIYVTAQSTAQSSSSTYDMRTLSMVGDGIVSIGWSNSTLRVSATQSNQAFSAAGGSSAFQTLSFSDNPQASFTNNAGQLAITNVRMSYSATGNTTQSSSNTANLSAMTFGASGMLSVGASGGSVLYSAYPPLSTWRALQAEGMQTGVNSLGTSSSGVIKLYPYQIPVAISAGALGFPISMSFNTNTGTDVATWGLRAALYTRGTGANSTTMGTWWSSSFSVGISWSNTSTISINQPTSTNFAGFTSAGTSSGGSNITSVYTGAKLIEWPLSSLVTPGNYWLGVLGTASSNLTSGGIVASMIGIQVNNNIAFTGLGPIGSNSSAYSLGADPFGGRQLVGLGSWTSAGSVSALPVSVAFTSVTAGETLVPILHFWST